MVQLTEQQLITETFNNIGWITMIVGNSLVLYSRLHLITQNRTMLRIVFWGILINSFLMYVPTTVLNYGANVVQSKPFIDGYNIMERIQMTLFSVQEFAISGVYLVEAYRFLRVVYAGDVRRLMYELVAVNAALILLDIALLSVEYEDLYEIETTLKGMVYSIKLKLELGVLSRLVKLATNKNDPNKATNTLEHGGTSSAIDGSGNASHNNNVLDKLGSLRQVSTTRTEHSNHTNNNAPWLTNPASLSLADRAQSWLSQSHHSRDQSNDLSLSTSQATPPPPPKTEHWANMGFVTMPESANADATRELHEEISAELGVPVPAPPLVKRPLESSRSSSITGMYPGRIEG